MEFSSYTTINGRYQLVKKVGRGSFGEVWLAEDTLTKTQVAIKLYIALDDKGLQEFSSEYITTYSLNHPNLLHATYYDIYENMPFLVMPFCPGSSENLIGNTDEKEVWRFIRDTAAGLEYLHSKDIIHRDIKPDNILRNTQGDYLITDFGVSLKMRSTLRRNSKRENGEGDASGTLPYMGPEMFSSQPNSVKATDIWALGATIFEIITGELPYCGQGGVMILHGADAPIVPGEWSQNLKAMIQACLSKETWERPTAGKIRQFADEVLHDKEVFWGDIKEIHIPSVEEKITQSPSATKKSTQYPKQNVKPWLIGIGAIAILTLIVVLHYISRPQTEIIVEPLESATEVYSNGFSVRGTVAGHEYVDLGLPSGVLWATCNIGASSPSEYGGYFAWGETSEKKKYDYVSLKYYNNDDKDPYSFSKYNINVSGTKDMKSQLELCDDAANVIWGDKWRIPTEQEWKELKEYCIWSWEKEEGHYGYKVSSPKTGNSIFLPAAGMKDDTFYEHVGQWGRYWSSSLSKDAFSYNAIRCCMSKTEIDPANWHHRCYGHSIRPVISSLNSGERAKDVKDVLVPGRDGTHTCDYDEEYDGYSLRPVSSPLQN